MNNPDTRISEVQTAPAESYMDTSPVLAPLAHAQEMETGKAGMIAFLITEVAFFSTLIVTYITYIGQSRIGPFPNEVFNMTQVLLATACLLSSSVTIHFAGAALARNSLGGFRALWLTTIILGALFLVGTAIEWHDLIFRHNLTPARNLFGTTYFTLVGFHALHVTIGVITMLVVFGLAMSSLRPTEWPLNPELVSWYWHFVDIVWVVVFTVVYLVDQFNWLGRMHP
jgi:cytochrome c oxidase subunit 3/cytochrome o ubiquinol oxidase subunit 3